MFKKGDFVGFTFKSRYEAKSKRRGNITAIVEGWAWVDCSGEMFKVPLRKLEKLNGPT